MTLMDSDKVQKLKTEEALAMAVRWEKQSPMPGSDRSKSGSTASASVSESVAAAAAAAGATNGRDVSMPLLPSFPAVLLALTAGSGLLPKTRISTRKAMDALLY